MRRLCSLIVLAWLATGAAVAELPASDQAFDRSNFANSELPLWSALTPLEKWTLGRLPAARSGDADALLALYVVASGDRRDMADFRRYRDRLDEWEAGLKLSRDPADAPRNARRAYLALHDAFLSGGEQIGGVSGHYREAQSQLTGIFETGEFNCISSALLFTVAARRLELPVEGVVLPSHAFVQLRFPGRVIEVETTSLNGFDLTHDEAFYSDDADHWFSDRSLTPPSYQDYLDREITSPWELGVFNMHNQHTAETRMSFPDRMRLAEIRAHLLPDNEAAQKSRLAYYYQEYSYLRDAGDWATAARLYDQLAGYLGELERTRVADPELRVLLTAVQTQMADTLARTGHPEEGLALARRLLQEREFPDTAASVETHLFSVVSGYAVERAEHKDYPGARTAFDTLELQCLENRVCNSGLAQIYSAWAMHYAEDEDWERTAGIYQEYLLLDSDSNLSSHFTDNLERVYLNWAAREEWSGEWERAQGLLNECTQLLDAAGKCEAALETLNNKVDAGYL